MKKILYIAIAVMAAVLLLCGCSEADKAKRQYFQTGRLL